MGDVSIHLDAPNGGETWSLGAQTISWTPAGVGAVDVELSRDGGQTWRPIATHVAGSSMTWNVSPPGTTNARMRVRDAVYRTVVDASDAPFTILDGVVAAPAAALKAGLRLVGRNPARGSVAFVLDVPVSADASVALYDAAGRRVRVLANGPYRPGSYDLAWDGRNDGGAGCRSGVYFVKARIGTVETRRKVVLL